MIDIFAIRFKGGVNFFLAEVKSISPADISMFHKENVRILTIIFLLEKTIVETGVDHEKNIAKIK